MPSPILTISNLKKERPQEQGSTYTLYVPSIIVFPGEKILLTGPSGCGKSTLLDIIGMVLKPDAVAVFEFSPEAAMPNAMPSKVRNVAAAWGTQDVESMALWRQHVGYVLQTGGLLPFISVHENILLPCHLLGMPSDSFVEELTTRLGITHLLKKYPTHLSVGERQRVAICRALTTKPALILADEPTAALDPANANDVLDLFTEAVDALGMTLILVTHAPEQVSEKNFRHLTVCPDFSSGGPGSHNAVLKEGETSVCAP